MSSRPIQQNQDRKVLAAIQKYLASTNTVVTLNGTDFTTADLVKMFQHRIDLGDATVLARGQLGAAAKAERDNNALTTPDVRAFRGWILSKYAKNPGALADFGYAPRKAQTKTSETKAKAAELALATRKARHTMGKRQKAEIKGTLPGPSQSGVTPAEAPPAASGGNGSVTSTGSAGASPHGPSQGALPPAMPVAHAS